MPITTFITTRRKRWTAIPRPAGRCSTGLTTISRERFGRLNDKRNLDLIKMDARGTEILSLERYIDGKARKADIFERPVAFNPDEITHADDASEALVASLNKYGRVEPHYMASLTGTTVEGILGELKGRIYYNPETDGYEVADKFIAGNVIGKAERIEAFLRGESRPRPGPGIAGGSARGDAQTHRFRRPGFQPGRTVDSKKVFTSVSPLRSSIRR